MQKFITIQISAEELCQLIGDAIGEDAEAVAKGHFKFVCFGQIEQKPIGDCRGFELELELEVNNAN